MATRYLTADLKLEIDAHEKRINLLERNDGVQDERLNNLEYDFKDQAKLMKRVSGAIIKIEVTNESTARVAKWAIGIVTALIITFLGALITGSAQIIFP